MVDGARNPGQWSDRPLARSDIKGRAEFAHVVARQIDACAIGQDSTVFGLVGPWGGGKTTLLSEIAAGLSDWDVVWFSPWSASDVGAIADEFVSTIAAAFPRPDLKKKIARYARYGTPALKIIPVLGEAASEVVAAGLTRFDGHSPWHEEFDQLSAAIAAEGRRVLVVVDDVDRLDGDELRSLLRVVRLLGRFTNVHYLMAYDEATIEASLGEVAGRGYMDKIVQYPFEVPPAPRIVRRQWAAAVIEVLMPSGRDESPEVVAARRELLELLAAGLETPRASGRLKEQVSSLATLVASAELDALDFIALTWLRIAHHDIWERIRRSPRDYLSLGKAGPGGAATESSYSALTPDEEKRTSVRGAIDFLFLNQSPPGFEGGRRWRLQNDRYFERYFNIGLAGDDVSEQLVYGAVEDLVRGASQTANIIEFRSIITGNDSERAVLAFIIAREARRGAYVTSSGLIDFVDSAAAEVSRHGVRDGWINSDARHWLRGEISIALLSGLRAPGDLVERFGFAEVMRSFHPARRADGVDPEKVKSAYRRVTDLWLREVSSAPFADNLLRPDLVMMSGLCLMLSESSDGAHFLRPGIVDSETLINAAIAFSTYQTWSGRDVEYELAFNRDEFLFAVGSDMPESVLSGVPPVEAGAPDATRGLAGQTLTDGQVREFACRHLADLFGSG